MRFSFGLVFVCILCFVAKAESEDSLKRIVKNLSEIRKADPADITECYALYRLCEYVDDKERNQIWVNLRQKSLAKLKQLNPGHPSYRDYHEYLAYACDGVGILAMRRGDIKGAILHHIEALKYGEVISFTYQIAASLNNIGLCYYYLGNYSKSAEYVSKALKYKEKERDTLGCIIGLVNMGGLNIKLNRMTAALNCYNRCFYLASQIKDQQYISEAILCLGWWELTSKNYDKARVLYEKSLVIKREIRDTLGLITVLTNLGDCLFRKGLFSDAIIKAEEALKLSEIMNDVERIQKSALILKESFASSGNYSKAFKMAELYFRMRDSLSNDKNREAVNKAVDEYNDSKQELIHKYELEKQQKSYENKRKLWKLFLIGFFVSLIFVICLIYYRYKYKKEQENKNNQIKFKEELKLEVEQKEEIANSLLLIQEQEREKLAAELHDGVNQLLFAAKVQLQASKSTSEEMHRDAIKLVETAIEEIRSIAGNQGSFILNGKSLIDALSDLIQSMKANQNIKVVFKNYGLDSNKIPATYQTHILRIIQELLNNAIRHSGAKECRVTIKTIHNSVNFSVTDNGRGMNLDFNKAGNGTKNIQNKVNLMRGKHRIFTVKNKGCKVFITIPFNTHHDKNTTG